MGQAKAAYPSLEIAHINMDRTQLDSGWFIEYRMLAARSSGADVDVEMLADAAVIDLFLLRYSPAV